MENINKEQALINLLRETTNVVKEANTRRSVTKKTENNYQKALKDVCQILGVNPEDVDSNVW